MSACVEAAPANAPPRVITALAAHLIFAADPAHCRSEREAIHALAQIYLPEDRWPAVEVAVGEALTNAFVHGKVPIHVWVAIPAGIFQVVVQDSGEGFDLDHLPEPDVWADHGRGIPIIRDMTDEARWIGRGRTVTLRWHRPGAAEVPEVPEAPGAVGASDVL